MPAGSHRPPVDVLLSVPFDLCDWITRPNYTLSLVRLSLRDSACKRPFADTGRYFLEQYFLDKCWENPRVLNNAAGTRLEAPELPFVPSA